MQPPIMRPAPRIASGVFNVMEAFKTRPGTLLISSDPMVIAAFNSVCEGLRHGRHRDSLSCELQILSDAEDQAFASPDVSGGKNPPINGDGDFFGGVWAFHRRPSALRMPSCSWL